MRYSMQSWSLSSYHRQSKLGPSMRLLLIRHGETVDNVAGLYAGVTDSALTNHGVLQTKKLAAYLAPRHRITHLFSSDLSRAYKTAGAILEAQHDASNAGLQLYQLKILQEQDFGSFERMTFAARTKAAADGAATLILPETKQAMAARANEFLDNQLLPLLVSENSEESLVVVVVAHGQILSTLWRCLIRRLAPSTIDLAAGIDLPVNDMLSLEHIGAWSNTGFLELDFKAITPESSTASAVESNPLLESRGSSDRDSPILHQYRVTVLVVNNTQHLRGLKRTGGGVGSSRHDDKQKSLESFFKKPRTM